MAAKKKPAHTSEKHKIAGHRWVVMRTSMAGDSFSYMPGDTIQVSADLCREWCEAGICELAPEDGQFKGGLRGMQENQARLQAELDAKVRECEVARRAEVEARKTAEAEAELHETERQLLELHVERLTAQLSDEGIDPEPKPTREDLDDRDAGEGGNGSKAP